MKNPLAPNSVLASFGQQPPLAALPKRFRLCVWNWHKCKHPRWKRDFLHLSAQSDLFLAQEARLGAPCREAILQSGLNWQAAISFLSPAKRIPTGIAAGCRAPALEVEYNASVKEPLIRIPKMMMRLVYPLAGTRLLVVNLHAINFTGLAPFESTLLNMKRLLEDFEGPVIAAGDFNVWNRRRQESLMRTAAELGLKEVLFSPDLRTRYMRHTVDYIFTRGLRTEAAAVFDTDSSDHRPLTALLSLP